MCNNYILPLLPTISATKTPSSIIIAIFQTPIKSTISNITSEMEVPNDPTKDREIDQISVIEDESTSVVIRLDLAFVILCGFCFLLFLCCMLFCILWWRNILIIQNANKQKPKERC